MANCVCTCVCSLGEVFETFVGMPSLKSAKTILTKTASEEADQKQCHPQFGSDHPKAMTVAKPTSASYCN